MVYSGQERLLSQAKVSLLFMPAIMHPSSNRSMTISTALPSILCANAFGRLRMEIVEGVGDLHILADSGFCDVDGILKTTEKFLTQIEEEYLQGSGSVRAATFVACRQAAEWGMKVLGS